MKNQKEKFFMSLLFLFLSSKLLLSEELPTADVMLARKESISTPYILPGEIRPSFETTMRSTLSGRILKIQASLGDKIKNNEALIILKQVDPQFAYKNVTLRAPFAGTIGKILVTPGQEVTKGQDLITLVSIGKIKVLAEIPGGDHYLFKKGDKGVLTLRRRGMNEELYEVKIEGIAGAIDRHTGTVSAEMKILERITSQSAKNKNIIRPYPGQIAKLTFSLNKHEGFLIKESLIQHFSQKKYVRVVRDGMVKRQEVILGQKEKDTIEVISGIKLGDHLISNSNQYFRMDTKVKENIEEPINNK